jgi:hypothetical protein
MDTGASVRFRRHPRKAAIITIDHVIRTVGSVRALDDVSIEVPRGQVS